MAMAHRDDPADELRRGLLLLWLARRGLAAAAALAGPAARAQVLGEVPRKLPPERSAFRLSGQVTANDKPVTRETRILGGDTLRTGRDSELVFVVGSAAMLMRADTQVSLQGGAAGGGPDAIKVSQGKLLAVFASGPRAIQTPSAAIRISGTGVYIEADPLLTYFCTCYGQAQVSALDDPSSTERVVSRHHDKPLYIDGGGRNRGGAIRRARFINHTDDELALIETLVGRVPPFIHGKQNYERPRPDGVYGR
jgi:hypothetical protein